MAMISKCGWLPWAVACVFGMTDAVCAQSPAFSITLTGQSMVRSDIRAHAPAAVPTIASLLGGDVVFTNFEATIIDIRKGQAPKDGRFVSPPEALESLKTFGFNLLSLSNNHSWDLKVPGIELGNGHPVGDIDKLQAGLAGARAPLIDRIPMPEPFGFCGAAGLRDLAASHVISFAASSPCSRRSTCAGGNRSSNSLPSASWDDHCPPLLRDRQSHHAERPAAGPHESGADQFAEQPDREAVGLQHRFGAAVRAAGQHFYALEATAWPLATGSARISTALWAQLDLAFKA